MTNPFPSHGFSKRPFIPPLKHRRYSGSMTLAVGLKYYNGLLLCADTELSGWGNTTHAAKIFYRDYEWGSAAFAYAGNSDFAISTIQTCIREMNPTDQSLAEIDIARICERQYRKKVFSHPQSQDTSLHYHLIVALCGPQAFDLFCTYQASMRRVDASHVCIGAGEPLATYLIAPILQEPLQERDALFAAAFTLGCVKGNVPGCGGASQFVFLRRGYAPVQLWSMAVTGGPTLTNTEWLERNSKGCEAIARRLWMKVASPDISDEEFERHAEEFKQLLLSMRADWRKRAHSHESFAELLDGGPKKRNLEDELIRRSPKGAQSHQPPSQESPGGSGES